MKLKEFLKKYYECSQEVSMKSDVVYSSYKELVLPGSYESFTDYKKTLSWNLGRDVYYREATKEPTCDDLYVTMTTGRMDFYTTFEDDQDFQDLLDNGLKKHRSYRKETIPQYDLSRKYLYYSKKYE